MRIGNKLLLLCGIIGPAFYWVLLTALGMIWTGYDPVSQSMSEIGAVDSPFKNAMNYAGFSLLGVFIILFSIGFVSCFHRSATIIISFALLLIGGVFMFLVGFFPCDAGCVDVTRTSELHSITSTIPAICLPLAAMLSAAAISMRWGNRFGTLLFFAGFLSMASGPLMFVPFFEDKIGLIQRLGIGFSLLWMMTVSAKALSRGDSDNTL